MSLSLRVSSAAGDVVLHDAARAMRVGGQTVSPGEARVVPVALPGRPDPGDAMPVWVAAGARPGSRVTIIAAPRGFESGAARVAAGLRMLIDPAAMHGGLLVVPVFRPGGRFSARGKALRENAAWEFPGDPGGNRRAREAFALFSELVVGSSVVLVLTAADPGLVSTLTVSGDFDDPRVRRLAPHVWCPTTVHAHPAAGSLAAAAREMGAAVLELRAPDQSGADQATTAAVMAFVGAAGTLPGTIGDDPADGTGTSSTPISQQTLVSAPSGGLLDQVVAAGTLVPRGSLLARIVPPLLGRVADVMAPHDAIVLESTTRNGIRARAPLFLLGRLSRAAVSRGQKKQRPSPSRTHTETPAAGGTPAAGERHRLHVGWVERVSLPSLGVEQLRAKIDTGARTSALHVTRMTAVGTTEGPHRRPILELTLPAASRRGAPPATVRVLVRDYVQVKDTSGRTERRPVIETTLRLGTLERRIRVTLTNRGDMLFPLLIGRTALGPGVVVDPARRLLLQQQDPGARSRPRPSAAGQEKPLTTPRPPRAAAAAPAPTVES